MIMEQHLAYWFDKLTDQLFGMWMVLYFMLLFGIFFIMRYLKAIQDALERLSPPPKEGDEK